MLSHLEPPAIVALSPYALHLACASDVLTGTVNMASASNFP